MPIDSDLSINVSKFMTESISEQTAKHNEYLIDLAKNGPTWWEVSYDSLKMKSVEIII